MSDGLCYFCTVERRRAELRRPGATLNGIDFLEVSADQQNLSVHFVRTPAPALSADAIHIDGGERIRGIAVTQIFPPATAGDPLVVGVSQPGDFSTYRLRIDPQPGLDPVLRTVDFNFKVDCPSDFDCASACTCAPEAADEPEIDYLAKDYESFRQLLLDRMTLLVPEWTERSPADVGVAVVELLAYVGDQLSYRQDAIATEAYLGTARRRLSVRRHAVLVDYAIGEGTNARAWVHVHVNADVTLPRGTPILTGPPAPETFETMHEAALLEAHNDLGFYTWGERECTLPAGATRATLAGALDALSANDVLVFEEVLGPHTGRAEDADPSHRHAVRLIDVRPDLTDPLFGDAPVTEIVWAQADALPLALCLSATTDADHGARPIEGITVAHGNIVLADHGRTIKDESLGTPARLNEQPLTQIAYSPRTGIVDGRRRRLAFDPAGPATTALAPPLDHVVPALEVRDAANTPWLPQRDLLSSDAFASEVVAETDDAGGATLRFGDGEYGRRAPAGGMSADYRVGNGRQGNVGADALAQLVSDDPTLLAAVDSVRNPLPARGGLDPEPLEHVRQSAPAAFRTLDRAVTPEDYAALAERHPQVQRVQATLRWTGSWRTVFLTVDRIGGLDVDDEFEDDLRAYLERYRMAGHDLEIDGPRFVALELELSVCVAPGYFRSDVERAVREALGPRGVFDPDNFTFGQPVRLSVIYAAVSKLAGVSFAEVRTLQRLGVPSRTALDDGKLAIGRLEIARLAADPSFPERGVLRVTLEGGR